MQHIDLHGLKHRKYDIEPINETDFWIGTNKGLFKRTQTELIDYSKKNALFSARIVDLDKTNHYGLVIATRGSGIYLYKNNKLTIVDKKNGLKTNDISNIYVDTKQNIWVSTNNGLHKIDAFNPSKIDFFSVSDGILSNEITDVCRIKDIVYIGTKKGLSTINLKTFKQETSSTKLIIKDIVLNVKPVTNNLFVDIYPKYKFF